MAEVGGPALSEIQPQPAGVVDRVKGKLREVLTPTGRAEVMAQKQIDAILVQVPEDKRAEAMQILESKRPDLVAGKMEDAKGSLVRDAVVGAAAVGAVGVGIWQRDRIAGSLYDMAGGVDKAGKGIGKAVGGIGKRIGDMRQNISKGVAEARARRGGGKTPDVSKLMDALSGAIKLDALDVLDAAHPITNFFEGKVVALVDTELQNTQAESLVEEFTTMASGSGRWVAMVTGKDQDPFGLKRPAGQAVEGMGLLIQKGLVTIKELTDGKKLFIPTEELVLLAKKNLHK